MSSGPEFSPPQIHRISAFLFFELWPRVIEKFPGIQSPLDRLRWLMYGLAVCDYTAFPSRRDERSKRDFLASFDQGTEITLHIANETVQEKQRWFSREVDVIKENSAVTGVELWWTIVTRSSRSPSGDYWGSLEFKDFFERDCGMKIVTTEDLERFNNALKNTKRMIRKAEKKHKTIFEDLILDCAVEAETLRGDLEKAEEVRRCFNRDRPKYTTQFLGRIIEALSTAPSPMEVLRIAHLSIHGDRLHTPFGWFLPPSSSKQKIE